MERVQEGRPVGRHVGGHHVTRDEAGQLPEGGVVRVGQEHLVRLARVVVPVDDITGLVVGRPARDRRDEQQGARPRGRGQRPRPPGPVGRGRREGHEQLRQQPGDGMRADNGQQRGRNDHQRGDPDLVVVPVAGHEGPPPGPARRGDGEQQHTGRPRDDDPTEPDPLHAPHGAERHDDEQAPRQRTDLQPEQRAVPQRRPETVVRAPVVAGGVRHLPRDLRDDEQTQDHDQRQHPEPHPRPTTIDPAPAPPLEGEPRPDGEHHEEHQRHQRVRVGQGQAGDGGDRDHDGQPARQAGNRRHTADSHERGTEHPWQQSGSEEVRPKDAPPHEDVREARERGRDQPPGEEEERGAPQRDPHERDDTRAARTPRPPRRR